MANTFIKIQTVTVGSGGASTIDFTSIPQTYNDLLIVISGRGATNTGSGVEVRPNGATTNLTRRYLETNIQSAAGAGLASDSYYLFQNNSSFTASIFGNSEVYIPNYTSTTQNKTFTGVKLTENNTTLCDIGFAGGLWASTTAITSINLVPAPTVTFAQYTTATLYGIKSS